MWDRCMAQDGHCLPLANGRFLIGYQVDRSLGWTRHAHGSVGVNRLESVCIQTEFGSSRGPL